MGFSQRLAGIFSRKRKEVRKPRLGQIIKPSREDTWREYPADGLTPGRLTRILKAADAGDLTAAMALYEQMEEKDAHLYSVANTRRLALTGLSWQIISAADVIEGVDRVLADEAADYCREVLANLDEFEEILQHLALAIGRNVAVAELVWELSAGRHRLVAIVPVPFNRLIVDEYGRLRILTRRHPTEGIGLLANKFVVHTPQAISGHPARGSLLRVTAMAFLGKHYAMKDWLIFAEVFGMPFRIARYEPSATPQEKRELLEMLKNLGTDAAGIFSKAVELEIKESRTGARGAPYEALCNFFNREMSKAWLGQTLTTDTAGATGTFAAAQIHERVRQDLREDDVRKESRTVRRDILRPLVELRFGPNAPVPFFRRSLQAPRDIRQLADVLSVAVNQLGLKIPLRWAHEALGIPASEYGEKVLPGRPELQD